MNTRSLPVFAAVLLFAAPVGAQSGPRAGQTNPPSTPTQPRKTMSLKISGGTTMSAAVNQLSTALDSADLADVNVVYGPGAAAATVPEIELRHVTGADALRLIAISADCETEVIAGEEGAAIGYLVRKKSDAVATAPGQPGFAQIQAAPELVPSPGAPSGSFQLSGAGDSTGGFPAGPQISFNDNPNNALGGGGTLVFNAQAPVSAASVRIYPLGELASKFDDVETSLRDVLKADGVSADHAKLAVHQKTGILVVTGTARVHELVTQLLDALRKNLAENAAQRRLEEKAYEATARLEVQLQAEHEQNQRLREQLAKAEDQLRALDLEFNRLKAVKSPSGQ